MVQIHNPVLVNVIILPPPHSKQLSVPVHFMQFAINVLESAHFLHLLFQTIHSLTLSSFQKNADKNKCVTDCHADDINYYLQKDNLNCATTCNVGEYKSGSVCKYCSETLGNCSTCNADATLCLTCPTGYYLTSTSNGCVKDCKEDSNHLLNKETT